MNDNKRLNQLFNPTIEIANFISSILKCIGHKVSSSDKKPSYLNDPEIENLVLFCKYCKLYFIITGSFGGPVYYIYSVKDVSEFDYNTECILSFYDHSLMIM